MKNRNPFFFSPGCWSPRSAPAAQPMSSKRKTGFKAKLWGRRDSVVISVPPEYIEGLLARMERRAPEVPAAATNSSPVPAAPAP
jgi:hypothetical protein